VKEQETFSAVTSYEINYKTHSHSSQFKTISHIGSTRHIGQTESTWAAVSQDWELTAAKCRSLAGKLSLSCDRPVADG